MSQTNIISMCLIVISLTAVLAALTKEPLECHFTEPTEHQRCFGAVGQQLLLHLPETTNTEIILMKDDAVRILKIAQHQLESIHADYKHDSELFDNGTFKLGKVLRNDSGDYKMEQFGLNGISLRTVFLHLEIQAPVSKPAVSQVCLSPQQMKVSCSCESDRVEFILHLDDVPVIPNLYQSPHSSERGGSNITFSLHGQVTGNLKCFVFNNISRAETIVHLKSCRVHFPILIIVITTSALVTIFLFLLCLGKNHLLKKPTPTAVDEVPPENCDDGIVYSTIMTKDAKRN